jgi:beta-lactamase class A
MKLSRARITWILRAGAVAVSAALVVPSSPFMLSQAVGLPTGSPSAALPSASPSATAQPSQPAQPLSPNAAPAPGQSRSGIVTVTCADVGDLRVMLSPDSTPIPAAPLPSGVSLRTEYRATDSRTAATVIGGDHGEISCGEVPVNGVLFGALSGSPAPAGVESGDLFDGTLSISLATTDLSLFTTAPRQLAAAAVPGAGASFPFNASLQSYVASRSGRVSVAAFDATTGATYSFNAGAQHVCASIVKVAILGTLLRQAQDANRALTATERSLATRMIEQSDNNAATALWNEVGQGPGVKAFMNRVGMPSTTPGTDGLWGLTSTNAPDQVRLVRTVAYPNAVLRDASRAYIESLMRAVTPSQKWGVSAGVAAGTTVALKNGWLPRTDGWVINSIGHIRGGSRDYVVAVLQSAGPSMSYGIATAQQISGMVWLRLSSDFNGDGLTDLVARDTGGSIWLYPGNGTGGFLPRRLMSFGWNGMSAIVSPGDVTGDGHADLFARDAAGSLWLYPGTGTSHLGTRRLVGGGWQTYTITGAANLNGTGGPDLLARDSTGALWLYPFSGNAVMGARTRVSSGWNGYTFRGPGDLSGDARADVLARDAAGSLWLYRGNGAGAVGARTLVGNGWSFMNALATPGNWDRAAGNDVLARDAAGKLWLYPGNNAGHLATRHLLGSGWNIMTFIG